MFINLFGSYGDDCYFCTWDLSTICTELNKLLVLTQILNKIALMHKDLKEVCMIIWEILPIIIEIYQHAC